jgi:hypothetical protein
MTDKLISKSAYHRLQRKWNAQRQAMSEWRLDWHVIAMLIFDTLAWASVAFIAGSLIGRLLAKP